MTNCEAAVRIEEHTVHHRAMEGWHAQKITEALQMAIDALKALQPLNG